MTLWKIFATAVVSLFLSGCADESLPPFPEIEGCKIVWSAEPYCRCVNFTTGAKTSYAKEECNFSLRNGDWADVMEYTKELERRLKKSYRKPLQQIQSNLESVERM